MLERGDWLRQAGPPVSTSRRPLCQSVTPPDAPSSSKDGKFWALRSFLHSSIPHQSTYRFLAITARYNPNTVPIL